MAALIVTGVVLGCVYALIAAGYAIVHRTTGVLNFAQGAFVMLSGMGTVWFLNVAHLPYILAAAGGLVLSVAAGALVWMALLAPLLVRRIGIGIAVIATLIASYAFSDAVLLWQGPNPQVLPPIQPHFLVVVAGTRIDSGQIYVVVGMILLLLAVAAFLRHTPLGRQTRACAANRETAELLGISPIRVGGYAMCISAAVGAVGGLLVTPIQFTAASGATELALYGFVAAVLGGFGRMDGAVVGGIAIGLVQELTARYMSTAFTDAITFGILMLILIVRPEGILGDVDWAQWKGRGWISRGRAGGGQQAREDTGAIGYGVAPGTAGGRVE